MLFALKALPATFFDVFVDDDDDDVNGGNDIVPKYPRHLITHNWGLFSIFCDNRWP